MKTRNFIIVGVGLILLVAMAVPYVANRAVQSRIGPQYTYELSEQPKFLPEELARGMARETLTRDGSDSWQEVSNSRSVGSSNRIVFMFRNSAASTRFVHVDLDGSQVICQTSIGK